MTLILLWVLLISSTLAGGATTDGSSTTVSNQNNNKSPRSGWNNKYISEVTNYLFSEFQRNNFTGEALTYASPSNVDDGNSEAGGDALSMDAKEVEAEATDATEVATTTTTMMTANASSPTTSGMTPSDSLSSSSSQVPDLKQNLSTSVNEPAPGHTNPTVRPYFGDLLFSFQAAYLPIHSILGLIICTLGSLANVINIIVLTRPHMITAVNTILTAIAAADLIVNISNIPYLIHSSSNSADEASYYSWHWALYILFHAHVTVTAHTISLWLTCVLATWRYFVICRTTSANQTNWTVSLALKAIAATTLSVPLVCTPLYLSFAIVNQTNSNKTDITTYNVGFSGMAEDSTFLKAFTFSMFSCLTKLIPCVFLTYFTTVLIRTLLHARDRRLRLTSRGNVQARELETPKNALICRKESCQRTKFTIHQKENQLDEKIVHQPNGIINHNHHQVTNNEVIYKGIKAYDDGSSNGHIKSALVAVATAYDMMSDQNFDNYEKSPLRQDQTTNHCDIGSNHHLDQHLSSSQQSQICSGQCKQEQLNGRAYLRPDSAAILSLNAPVRQQQTHGGSNLTLDSETFTSSNAYTGSTSNDTATSSCATKTTNQSNLNIAPRVRAMSSLIVETSNDATSSLSTVITTATAALVPEKVSCQSHCQPMDSISPYNDTDPNDVSARSTSACDALEVQSGSLLFAHQSPNNLPKPAAQSYRIATSSQDLSKFCSESRQMRKSLATMVRASAINLTSDVTTADAQRLAEKRRSETVLSSTARARSAGSTSITPFQMIKLQATQRQLSQNETTTRLLIAVMIVFLICEFPAGILAACCAFFGQDFFDNVYAPTGALTDLLALINSSVNFILYCFMSTQFRITFYRVVLRCPAPNLPQQHP